MATLLLSIWQSIGLPASAFLPLPLNMEPGVFPYQWQKLITEPRSARFLLRRKLKINTLREMGAMEAIKEVMWEADCRDFQHLNTKRILLPYRRGQMSLEALMMEPRLLSTLTSWEDRMSPTALPIDLHYWGVRTRYQTFISERGSPATSLWARRMSEETSDCFCFRLS